MKVYIKQRRHKPIMSVKMINNIVFKFFGVVADMNRKLNYLFLA